VDGSRPLNFEHGARTSTARDDDGMPSGILEHRRSQGDTQVSTEVQIRTYQITSRNRPAGSPRFKVQSTSIGRIEASAKKTEFLSETTGKTEWSWDQLGMLQEWGVKAAKGIPVQVNGANGTFTIGKTVRIPGPSGGVQIGKATLVLQGKKPQNLLCLKTSDIAPSSNIEPR
jgi:hypothetical protein